jgi:hypothetical protein
MKTGIDNSIKELMKLLLVDEPRAKALYDAGYKSIDDLKNVGIHDLIKVNYINPTIARRIIEAAKKGTITEVKFTDISEVDSSTVERISDPIRGKLIYRLQQAKGFRTLPYIELILVICLFITIFIIIIPFYPIFSLLFIPELFCILGLPMILIFIIFIMGLYLDFRLFRAILLEINEKGITVGRRRVGEYFGPPRSYWGFIMTPIWQVRVKEYYIPFDQIDIIYSIYFRNKLVGLVVIDVHGKWYGLPIYFAYPMLWKDSEVIIEKMRLAFGPEWVKKYQGRVN